MEENLQEKTFEERREKAEKAIEEAREAAKDDDKKSLFLEGMAIYRTLAGEGDIESLLRLGDIFEELDQYEDSLLCYEEAAEKGSPRGQYDYWGIASEYFPYDEKKLKKGFAYLLEAARSNYPFSHFDLGKAYEFGIGVEEDMEKAISYYEKATEGEEGGFAAYSLGEVYLTGEKVKQDKEKARHWFNLAIEKGYTDQDEVKAIFEAWK